jgi:uncharacterized membrane protein
MDARSSITVNATPQQVYDTWHDFERLPSFMFHLQEVRSTGPGRSHWVAKGPMSTKVEWDAEIVDDVPGESIAWQSSDGSVDNAGEVRFVPAPGGHGTEVRVALTYSPPGGALGAAVAKVFGEEPDQQISDDLRRFKQIVETGEIARSESTPDGDSSSSKNPFAQRGAEPLDQPANGAGTEVDA